VEGRLQVKPHCRAVGGGAAVGTAQAVHEVAPQLAVLAFETHAPLQACKPMLQVKPHDVPLQVATELAGGVQAVHDVVPQLLTLVLATQAVATQVEAVLHVNPHVVPLQVARRWPAARTACTEVPQLLILVFDEQLVPQV